MSNAGHADATRTGASPQPHSQGAANDLFNVAGASDAIRALLEANRAYTALTAFLSRTMSEKDLGVNGEQALMLWNIARHEDENGAGRLRPGDLKDLGYFVGTNSSYNLTKLSDTGYLKVTSSSQDRRVKNLSLTDDGKRVAQAVADCFTALDSVLAKYDSDLVLNDAFVLQLREIGTVTAEVARGAFLFSPLKPNGNGA